MVGLPLSAGWVLASSVPWNEAMRSRFAIALPLAALAVLQLVSFWWSLHRYVIGIDAPWVGFEALWQPPLGWPVLTVAYAAAVLLWAVALVRMEHPRVQRVPVEDERRRLRSVDAAA
jgi:hypothetical protein